MAVSFRHLPSTEEAAWMGTWPLGVDLVLAH